jgi:DedD protein
MPWPFSRKDPSSPGEGQEGTGGRQGETRDAAAEFRTQTRRRLIGAAALLLAAVIALPMLLDTAPRPVSDDISITVVTPPAPRSPPDGQAVIDRKTAEPPPAQVEPLPQRAEPVPADAPAQAAKAAKPEPAEPRAQPAPPAPPAKAAAAGSEKFVVQVAALSTPAAADELTARLVIGGFRAYVEAVSTAEGTLHRVRVGPFARRDEAQRAADRLKAAGHKVTVVGG